MGLVDKLPRFLMILLMLSIIGGIIYVYFFDQSVSQRGMRITTNEKNKEHVIDYYDEDLPSDLNYTDFLYRVNSLGFSEKVDETQYSKGTNPEQIIKSFNDTQSIKTWLKTIKMPNILRNSMVAVLDLNIAQVREITPSWKLGVFSWGATSTLYSGTTYALLQYESASYYILTLQQKTQSGNIVWEIAFKIPYTSTDYDVIFTRMPKP